MSDAQTWWGVACGAVSIVLAAVAGGMVALGNGHAAFYAAASIPVVLLLNGIVNNWLWSDSSVVERAEDIANDTGLLKYE